MFSTAILSIFLKKRKNLVLNLKFERIYLLNCINYYVSTLYVSINFTFAFSMIKQPPYLVAGDTVGIVATARKISPEELAPGIKILESWGLKVALGENLFHNENQFSGNDWERASDLQQMLNNPTIKAVIMARGGYGTVRIIDRIDFSHFAQHPKWLIGYSDVTVLHSHITNHFDTECLHAPLLFNFTKSESATASLKKALFGEKIEYKIPASSFNRSGQEIAQLVGGNLSILYSLAGTHSDIDTKGKILFIEDLDEYLYHIDRMMMQLKRSGKLTNLKGLIVGGMSDMRDNTIPFGKTAEQIIREAVEEYDYPVCFGFPAGHIAENFALILGREVELTVSEKEVKIHFNNR